jgi:hypothetical protein
MSHLMNPSSPKGEAPEDPERLEAVKVSLTWDQHEHPDRELSVLVVRVRHRREVYRRR